MIRNLPYKTKIALLTLVPLIIAIIGITLTTNYQTRQLANIQAKTFEEELLSTKKEELKNYLELAYSAINNIYKGTKLDPFYAQKEAYYVLKHMEFGKDGYFFVYDFDGVNIVHSRKPELEGRNLLDLQDELGNLVIQSLIKKAQEGGGYTRYLWDKPSAGESVEKLGYSIALEKWNWVVGTGIYIDDVQKGIESIKTKAENSTQDTLIFSSFIAIAAILSTALVGLLINLNESRLASQKMLELTHKTITVQEDERKRVSRELHDGINQLLVSVRFKLDNAKDKLKTKSSKTEFADVSYILDDADDILSSGIQEVRRISKDLRPTVLDDLGLSSALKSLINDFSERTNINVSYENNAHDDGFSQKIETAFYRIVQEAFTNIEKHASSAKNVELTIKKRRNMVTLSIRNDGRGFDKKTLDKTNPERGIGLRNMVDRAELLEGSLIVNSSIKRGTTVIVTIPISST